MDRVARLCATGQGFLDGGDTPAQPGLDAAATAVVGARTSGAIASAAGEPMVVDLEGLAADGGLYVPEAWPKPSPSMEGRTNWQSR